MQSCNTATLERSGYTLLRSILPPEECTRIGQQIATIMDQRAGDAIAAGSDAGTTRHPIVGGRNLLSTWDGWRQIVNQPAVDKLIRDCVGVGAGLVRILFFDKPPGKSWSLALHRDRTIAVAEHRLPPDPFSKPTKKAGIPHVEANETLLSRMLTLRLHLDPMHADNGPLIVVPRSHCNENPTKAQTRTIHCGAGDIFAMRPLLSHGSRSSNPQSFDHRRVVHLEIAPSHELPGGYQWNQFESVIN
jgi:hypothetical protein